MKLQDIDDFGSALAQLRGLVMAIRGAETIDQSEHDGLLTLSDNALKAFECIHERVDTGSVTPFQRRA
jgi:hypothetical protein